jgi:hypothetical protein
MIRFARLPLYEFLLNIYEQIKLNNDLVCYDLERSLLHVSKSLTQAFEYWKILWH